MKEFKRGSTDTIIIIYLVRIKSEMLTTCYISTKHLRIFICVLTNVVLSFKSDENSRTLPLKSNRALRTMDSSPNHQKL